MTFSLRMPVLGAVATAIVMMTSPAPDLYMGPGISRELAADRAANLSNVRYTMRLSVASPSAARGSITVHFAAKQSADVILDFRGPRIANIVVNDRSANTEFNGMHLRIPKDAIRAGENVVTADFVTPIAAAGASIIKFHDDKDGSDYLYTLLVPSDANLLFPCFDQPDLKARLTLGLTVPSGWQAIANGRTRSVDSTGTSWNYRFNESDPLPPYLFALAAGPWTRAPAP